MANKIPARYRVAHWLRHKRRRRLADVVSSPWWDWGRKMMALVGHDFCGTWSEPEPPTWWYRPIPGRSMWRTGYPRRKFQVVTNYSVFRSLTDGLNEDQMDEWKAISASQDGELILGHIYWGGRFFGMPKDEVRLLRRYLRHWRRIDWFGLRSWLYAQALHAAVHRRRPLRCNVTPPRGSGGYDHWHCGLKRRHDGPHHFGNYQWSEGDARVVFVEEK